MEEEKQEVNSHYRDWTKASLALKYLREGIIELTDGTVKAQHEHILLDIERQYSTKATGCSNCNIGTLLPVHSKDHHGKCPLGQKYCNCLNPKNKQLCPTMFCSAMYDKIILQHRYHSPNWKNTDTRHWHDNHWEIAKCNISDGYRSKICAKDTDTSGLLQVLINDLEMQNKLDEVIDPPDDIFSKVRKARDSIFHSASQELDETTTQEYIDSMIAILNDKKYLVQMEEAKKAKQKLLQLKENRYVITTQDEMEMRQEALAEINRKQEESLQVIEDKQENAISLLQTFEQNAIKQQLQKQQTEGKLREEMDKFFNQTKASTTATEFKLKEIENKQVLLEKAVESQRESQENISATHLQLESEMSNIKSSYHLQDTHKERIQVLNKQALKNILIEIYEKHHTKTSVLPMLPEEQVDVSNIYILPFMYTKGRGVNSYRDIFFTENKKNNTKIYITGNAGMGKSTFCKQMVKKWCTVQSSRENNEELETSKEEVDDLQILKSFKYLFHISLQHESKNTNIQDMIKDQLFEGEGDRMLHLVDELMLEESEKCLIILDGLDEWNPRVKVRHAFQNSNIPHLRARSKSTVITTSRPWKINSALLSPADVDLEVNIQGLCNFEKLVKNVTTYLNEKHEVQHVKDHRAFIKHIYCDKRLTAVRHIPMMLLQHICLWYDGKPLGDSLCETYSNMIDMFLQRSPDCSQSRGLQAPNLLPKCMQTAAGCKKYQHALLTLSRLAFETLFPSDGQSTLSFERSTALDAGMIEKDLELCLKTGILTESKIGGKAVSKRVSRLSFVHKSFHEFFSALHLYIDDTDSDTLETQDSAKAIIERIKLVCNTIPEVLQMANIFIFISGMKPSIAIQLSRHISEIVDTSDEIQIQRESLRDERCVIHIQELLSNCLKEMANKGQMNVEAPQIMLRDLVLQTTGDWQYLPNIDANNIKSLVIREWTDQKHFVQRLSKCKNLLKLTVILTTDPSIITTDMPTNLPPFTTILMELLIGSYETLTNLQVGTRYTTNMCQPVVGVICSMQKLSAIKLQNQNLSHDNVEELFSYLAMNTQIKELSLSDLKCDVHSDSCPAELMLNNYNLQLIELSNLKFKVSFSDFLNQEDPKLKRISLHNLLPQTEHVLLQAFAQMTQEGTKITSLTCSLSIPSLGRQDDLVSSQTLINIIPTLYVLKELEICDTDFGDNELNIGLNTELQSLRLISCTLTDKAIKSVMNSTESLKHSVTLYFGKCKRNRKEQEDIISKKLISWKHKKSHMKIHHLVYDPRDKYIEGLFQWEPE